jgi:glucosamine-6-phosphate deaminase
MEVIIQPDSRSAAAIAARIVARLVREKPAAVLGLATGKTPLPLYAELARLHREEGLDFSRVTTFNLDEYVGVAPDHPASYSAYMRKNLFDLINVPEDRIHIPEGLAKDVPALCSAYEEAIAAAGGLDVQILGIGGDGHIGFNEPTSSLASRTRIKTLTERTRRDNAADFGGEDKVPRHVITMGVGTIMESGMCLLLAFGSKKAGAVAQMIEGPVTAMVPASILQMHPSAKILLDEDAASALMRRDYYKAVFDGKPGWQQD